jgi:two-component system nitrogen regulation response regulator GlnG
MPPLRERREDIGRLLRHFLEQEQGGRPGRIGTSDSEPWLAARLVAELALGELPGNVRQLRQLARRLVIDWGDAERVDLSTLATHHASRAGGVSNPLRATSLPPPAAAPSERELLDALQRAEWQPSRAAALLGISRTRIYALIQRSSSLRTAASLRPELIRQQLLACEGDIERAARALKVSRRGLLLRLRDVGVCRNLNETET